MTSQHTYASQKAGFQVIRYVPVMLAAMALFIGMSQACVTGWMLLPLLWILASVPLGWRYGPALFLVLVPVSLLLDRTGIGPLTWLDFLLEGGNVFVIRRMSGFGLMDLNPQDAVSLLSWGLLGLGYLGTHAAACRLSAELKPPFLTGELVPSSAHGYKGQLPNEPGVSLAPGLGFALTLLSLVAALLLLWVFSEMWITSEWPGSWIQMVRWVLTVGGALVVGLLFRAWLGVVEARAMDTLAANGVLAETTWRELAQPLNRMDRWLMWWRLRRRRKAESRWRKLLRAMPKTKPKGKSGTDEKKATGVSGGGRRP
ncbi:MAG: hypothetical protein DWH82_09075 [Planctomycetota bacterium]|nr:MAG: hypothetical protein DWH82_09075 [Planctomycetota bacterium]